MEYINLGKICNIKTGKLDANASSEKGTYPFFTCSKEILKIDSYSYDCECVLVAGNGDLNVKYYHGKFDAYQRTYIIEVIDKSKFDTKFIYLLLDSKIEELRKLSIGGVIKYIKLNNLTDINVPVLSIEKQRKIVNKMFNVSKIIKLKNNQILKLNELIKSQFVEMFGDPITNEKNWNKVKNKELCSKIGSGATPKGGNSVYLNEGITFIRSMNVYDNLFEYKDLVFLDDRLANGLKNVVVEDNDILLNITGASVCRCCIVPNNLIPARVNQHVSILRYKNGNPVFILHQIISDSFKDNLYRISKSGGATREALTKTQLENLELIFPPIELQKEFAQIVEQIDKQKFVNEKILQNIGKIGKIC